jgi:hypothetical protein
MKLSFLPQTILIKLTVISFLFKFVVVNNARHV